VILLLILILRPLFWLFDGVGWLFRSLFGSRRARSTPTISWETVKLHLETGRAEGVVAEQDEALIHRIGGLNRLSADSLMIPLAELTVHPVSGTVGELRSVLVENRAPRVFLYRDEPRNLVGLIPARRLLGLEDSRPLAELAGNLKRVPAHRALLDLIDELQLTHSKFAVVTDIWGRCLGAVFLADLLRRIVHFHQDEQVGENGRDGADSR
jgi:CBS domain containing-hemolysin-like protein